MTVTRHSGVRIGCKSVDTYLVIALSLLLVSGFARGQTVETTAGATDGARPASGFRNPGSLTIEKSDNNAPESWTRYEVAATQAYTEKSGGVILPLLEVLCFDGGSTDIEIRTGELKRGSDVKITIGNLPTVSLVYGPLPIPYSDTIMVADLKNAGQMANINLKHLAAGMATNAPLRLEFMPSQHRGKIIAEFDTSVLIAEFKKNQGCIQ